MVSMKLTASEWVEIKNDIAKAKALMTKPAKDAIQSIREEMADYRRYMRGFFTRREIGLSSSAPLLQDNDFAINVGILRPNLYFTRPGVIVRSRRKDYTVKTFDPILNADKETVINGADSASMAENVLRWYGAPSQLNDQEVFRRCVDDGLVCGWSTHLTGWAAEENEIDLSGSWENKTETAEERLARIGTERTLELKKLNGDEIPGEQIDAEQQPSADIVRETLTSDRFSPFDFLVDPECKDVFLKTARFIGLIYTLPTKYVNKVFGLKLKGQSTAIYTDYGDMLENNTEAVQSLKRNEVILYMDIENRRWVYVVDELKDQPAKVIKWPWAAMEGFPVEILAFNQDNDRFLPIPDFRYYKQIVFKKLKLHSKLADQLDRINKTFLADETIAKKLDDILNSPTGGVVPVKRLQGQALTDFIKEVADFSISQSSINYLNILNTTIERVTGIADYRRGLVTEASRTATEIAQIAGEQNLRIEERKETLAAWMIRINRKRLQLLQENAHAPQIIRVDRDGKTDWPTWTKEDIQGEYDFDLDIESMLKKNKELEKKYAIEKYDKLANDSQENHEMLLKDVHEAYGDKEIEKRVIPMDKLTPPEGAGDKKEPVKLSVSLKLEPADLVNPLVQQLLNSSGVQLQIAPEGDLGAAGPGGPGGAQPGAPMSAFPPGMLEVEALAA